MKKKKEINESQTEYVRDTVTKPERYVSIKTDDCVVVVSSYCDDIKTINELAMKNVNAVKAKKKKKENYLG